MYEFILKELKEHSVRSLFEVFLLCIAVYFIAYWGFIKCGSNPEKGDASTFATGLVSCLAITGGILAVYFQHLELSLQRKELENTRIELQQQKEEITKQTSIFKEDLFAQSFFNMFQIYKNCISKIHGLVIGPNMNVDYQSIEYLSFKLNSLQTQFRRNNFSKDQKAQSISEYTSLFCECNSLFLSLVYLVENSKLNDNQKSFYYNILKNVSILELLWLALYSVTHDTEEFKQLEKKGLFDILKHYLKLNANVNPLNHPDSHWFDIFEFLEVCFSIKVE